MGDLLEIANSISTNNYEYNTASILECLLYIKALSNKVSEMYTEEFSRYCERRDALSFNNVCNYLKGLDEDAYGKVFASCLKELDSWILNFVETGVTGSELNPVMFNELCKWFKLFIPIAWTSRNDSLADYVPHFNTVMYDYAEERLGEYFTVENRKLLGGEVD